MKILVADDDGIVVKLLEKLLSKWGYETESASDGLSALKSIESPSGRPDVAILDWMMPGMNGPELCKSVKSAIDKPFIYLILLTGKNNESDVVDGLNAGADDYMVKPIKAEELKSRIAAGARMVEYERRLTEINRRLKEQNDALEKYARILESLAEERARQLIHAERLSAIGEMSAGIAHEINNYLTPVMGYAEMLGSRLKSPFAPNPESGGRMTQYLDEISLGAKKIKSLVERIRLHSRKGESARAPSDLNEILLHSMELCNNSLKRCKVERELGDGLPPVLCDPQEIEQVFVNIVKNAADAMKDSPVSFLKVSTALEQGRVVARIKDSGAGIKPEHLEHIWESFFTTKGPESGTGLGLSVSKRIIESHGGLLEASNHPDGGAVFTIVLPPCPPPAPTKPS